MFACFEYKECRTKIPYLKKLENGYMAVYPHLSAYPKENEALIMKVNQMILSHCGVNIVENRIVYLNKEYVRQDALDLNELLCISDKNDSISVTTYRKQLPNVWMKWKWIWIVGLKEQKKF